ncbi:MAG: helix-turn-helix domain-containing protein [Candidatus Nanopelagicales bacterium]
MLIVSSGVPGLDDLLGGGILVGDNVVWVAEPTTFDIVSRPLLAGAGPGESATYVTLTQAPEQAARKLPKGVEILDARGGQTLADPGSFVRAVVERGSRPHARIVVDGLDAVAERFGPEGAIELFTRTCPVLFGLGAIAYWRISRNSAPNVIEAIRRLTQSVLEIRSGALRVIKAERRPNVEGKIVSADTNDGQLRLGPEKVIGRLAAGLRKIRTDRDLTQADLGRLAAVSPSAISQAEAGMRGLGLDTLLRLSQNLQISIDEILSNRTAGDYILARYDTLPTRAGVTPMFDHPNHGLRGYLVELGPGESGAPRSPHKDAEAILVASGLVKVDLGNETPVLRAGDAVLVTRVPVLGWANLLNKPSRFFWLLREPGHVGEPTSAD